MNITPTTTRCTLVLEEDTVLGALGMLPVTRMEGTITCEICNVESRQFPLFKLMGPDSVRNETR